MFLVFKTMITAFIVVSVSEIAKRNTLIAAIVAALPIISILTFIWVYTETKSTQKVMELCQGIGVFVLPTLVFFLLFPWLLKKEYGFWLAMGMSLIPMAIAYIITLKIIR
jgi:hypothetical protein